MIKPVSSFTAKSLSHDLKSENTSVSTDAKGTTVIPRHGEATPK